MIDVIEHISRYTSTVLSRIPNLNKYMSHIDLGDTIATIRRNMKRVIDNTQ